MNASGNDLGGPLYSPAEICKWFDLPRTTLFRWEREGDIQPAERIGGERAYRRHHIAQILHLVRTRLRTQSLLAARSESPGPVLTLQDWERLYLAEYFTYEDHSHGLQQLYGVATRKPLEEGTVRLLVEDALRRPPGDRLRVAIWQLVLHSDRDRQAASSREEDPNDADS
jgi:DNA-binding transcriptional MerR regulator